MVLSVLCACAGTEEVSPTDMASVGIATTSPTQPSIAVKLQFPQIAELLVGPATGTVVNDQGQLVTEFEFSSGWVLPDSWEDGARATPSGAATVITVKLPGEGRYTFILDDFGVSQSPCGTCERGYSGGKTEANVEDGSMVILSAGQSTWIS